MEYVLRNAIVLTPLERLPGAHVAFSGGSLTGIGKNVYGGAPGVDLTGYTVAPGFIDVHVHGGGGYSLIDGDPRDLQGFRQWVLRTGVTSFLMSVMAATPEELVEAVKENKAEVGRGGGGACCLGFHLEGPFLSPRRPGAFDPSWFRLPDKSLMDEFLGAGEGTVRVVTVAPELSGAPELIQHVSQMGVLVALGHTDATYEDFMAGVRAGARHVTHCYNTMRGFGHREPGAMGAALVAPVTAELIADGVHVHRAAMDLLMRVKEPGDVLLVTDAMAGAGLSDGVYSLAGREVHVRQGRAVLADGTLAGSVLTMDQAVRNVVGVLGRPVHEAVRMATWNPARCLNLHTRKGLLAPGMDADLVVLDRELEVAVVLVAGRVAYCRERERELFSALPRWSGDDR